METVNIFTEGLKMLGKRLKVHDITIKGSKVPGFQGSKVQGFKGSRVQTSKSQITNTFLKPDC
jgi:hypothetical protein